MKAWTTLFVISMFATVVALAGDVDDVKAAEDNYYAAMNSGDARGWAQSRLSEESTRFGPGGALLEVFGSLEEQEKIEKPNLMPDSITIYAHGIETSEFTATLLSSRCTGWEPLAITPRSITGLPGCGASKAANGK